MSHRQNASTEPRGVAALVERLNAALRTIATPSLTQLVLRCALAVPFWRSGVNKWDGFLQLNDVAVLLFGSELKLHLPGGPYDFRHPRWWRSLQGQRRSCCQFSLLSASRRDWRHSGCC